MMEESFEDGRQNRPATQVGWPAFKRARRLKRSTRDNIHHEEVGGQSVSVTTTGGSTRLSEKEETPRRRGWRRGGVGDEKQRSHAEVFSVANIVSLFSCDNNNNDNMNSSSGHQPARAITTMTANIIENKSSCSKAGRSLRQTSHANIHQTNVFWSRATLKNVVICSILLIQMSDLFCGHLNFKYQPTHGGQSAWLGSSLGAVEGSLIIGDSAIEIHEVEDTSSNGNNNQVAQNDQQQREIQPQQQVVPVQQEFSTGPNQFEHSSVVLGTTGEGGSDGHHQQTSSQPPAVQSVNQQDTVSVGSQFDGGNNIEQEKRGSGAVSIGISRLPSGPLPPLSKQTEDITDGDRKSRGNHDYDLNELGTVGQGNSGNGFEKGALSEVLLGTRRPPFDDDDQTSALDKTITGKVVDFELQPAGGHNKAKIKKKKKKKKKEEEEEVFKKWGRKKKMEKKAMEKEEKKHMKKKKEEGKKGKKKWGVEEHGQKKKGNFKKKKWGKKVKKGKGVKKGKKGKKFLKDKGHKNTGFKTVYHKEEWGKSSKWHDIKREKKWDEKSKKWKKKWKKEKGKKYKGDHMKKFEKKKKEGKKYKKAKKEKYKKYKKEEFEKGKKKKIEEHKKKKEGGAKKEKKKS